MNSKVAEASSEVIAAFMQQVIVQYYSFGGHFRRVEPRESVAIPIRLCPLDESFEPQGDEFNAVTRDVSCSGIGVFHTRTIETPFVKITIAAPETGHQMNLLARVEHCTPCGDYQIVGCRLVGSANGGSEGGGEKLS